LPAAQSVQFAGPEALLNCPVVHAAQVPPSGPVKPALHVQLVMVMLSSGEFEFDGHVSQAAALAALYVAAPQPEQVDSETAATDAEYFPATQSVQFAGPEALLNCPVVHAAQVPPSGPV